MGLGKTIIAIAAAEKLAAQGEITTCVIVCPASLKYQWAQRIAQFTDCDTQDLKVRDEVIVVPLPEFCMVIDGNKKGREEKYAYVRHARPSYIIMGYDNVIHDHVCVGRIKHEMVVLDEATAIKSFKAQRTKRIKKLLRPRYRLALTGTPIENRPDELFSIMQWVDEDVLGRYDLFDKAYMDRNRYGWVVSYKNLPVLRKRLAPALARKSRSDPDVAPYLPDVDEDNWYVESDAKTQHLYKKIAADMLVELDTISPYGDFDLKDYYSGSDESMPAGKLMAMYMCQEMLLDHPDLIIYSAKLWESSEEMQGSKYAYHLWQSGALDEVTSTPKLDLLVEKIELILETEPDAKILVFSVYKQMLRLIQYALDEKEIRSVKFHGDMNPARKAEAVAKFTNDVSTRVFLSSHAGAYGMDMYMANYLINVDHPWSAGKADQINSRHIRTSSEFTSVCIRNMVTRDTIEERKLRVLRRKRNVGTAILDGHGDDGYGKIKVDGDSLRDHLTACLT